MQGARIPGAIPDAKAYTATLAEMNDFVELIANVGPMVERYGAVRIDPPAAWVHPPLRMSRDSRFFVKNQSLPEAPFVDTAPPDPDDMPALPPDNKRQRLQAQLDDDEDVVVVVRKTPKRGRAAAHARRRHPVNYADDHDADDALVVVSPGDAVIDLVNHPSDDGPVGQSVATSAEPPTSVTPNSLHTPTAARLPVAASAGSGTTDAATPVMTQVEVPAQPSVTTAADESRQTTPQLQPALPPKTQLQTAGQDIPAQVVAPQSHAPIASSIPVPHQLPSRHPLSLRMHLQIPSPSTVSQLPQQRPSQEPPNVQQMRTGPNLPLVPRSTPNISQTASGLSQGVFPNAPVPQPPTIKRGLPAVVNGLPPVPRKESQSKRESPGLRKPDAAFDYNQRPQSPGLRKPDAAFDCTQRSQNSVPKHATEGALSNAQKSFQTGVRSMPMGPRKDENRTICLTARVNMPGESRTSPLNVELSGKAIQSGPYSGAAHSFARPLPVTSPNPTPVGHAAAVSQTNHAVPSWHSKPTPVLILPGSRAASTPSLQRTTPTQSISNYETIVPAVHSTVGGGMTQSFPASKIHAAQWTGTLQPQPGVSRMLHTSMHSNAMNTNADPRNTLGNAAHRLGEEQRNFLRQQHGMVIGRLPISSELASAPVSRATRSVQPSSFPVHGYLSEARRYLNEPQTPSRTDNQRVIPNSTATSVAVSQPDYGSPDVLRSNPGDHGTPSSEAAPQKCASNEETIPNSFKRGSLNSILNHEPVTVPEKQSVVGSMHAPQQALTSMEMPPAPTGLIPKPQRTEGRMSPAQKAPSSMDILAASASSALPAAQIVPSTALTREQSDAFNAAQQVASGAPSPQQGLPDDTTKRNPEGGGTARPMTASVATISVVTSTASVGPPLPRKPHMAADENDIRSSTNGIAAVAVAPQPKVVHSNEKSMSVDALPIAGKGSETERVVSKAVAASAGERPSRGENEAKSRPRSCSRESDPGTMLYRESSELCTTEPHLETSVAPGATSSSASGIADAVVKTDTAFNVKPHANNATPSVSAAVEEQNKKSEHGLVEDLTWENPRPLKRAKKPSRDHVSLRKWAQDECGRLLEYPTFPDSPKPISLRAYESKAMTFSERMRKALVHDKRVNKDVLRLIEEKADEDWTRNPDVLEGFFWEILHKGVNGKPIAVNYGVDVEAEGAYKGESYVEWYGMDDTGRLVKKEKRPVTGGKKEASKAEATVTSAPAKPEDIIDDDERRRSNNGKPSAQRCKKRKRKVETSFADFPGPKCHVGNLNMKGLLRHMPRMPGVNHSMFYVGHMFTRFCWHTEDAFLNSVSYLHRGSADKIWYAIPPKYAEAFETYAAENIFSDRLAKDQPSAQRSLMCKTTIFDPRELKSRGIECYRIRHKPGSFVLTAPRAYHAGFNCGFNIAEAVNFANPGWFPVGRQASVCARRGAYTLIVPYEYLLFHEAKSLRDAHLATTNIEKIPPRARSDARILAGELGAVMEEGEKRLREYAQSSNCRIAMLNDVDGLVKNNQLGPEFGPGAGVVCSICKHACHFYAEICGSCPDNREARCVSHFGRKFSSRCRRAGHKPVLVRRHDPVLLGDLLSRLEDMAGVQTSTEKLLRRYRGFLRTWETPLRSSGLRLKLNLKLAASRAPPTIQQKERRRKPVKRSEQQQRKRELEEDPDFEHEKKRRKSEAGRKLKSARQKETSAGRRNQDAARRKSGSRASSKKRKREDEVATVASLALQPEMETQSVEYMDAVLKPQPVMAILGSAKARDDDYLDVAKP